MTEDSVQHRVCMSLCVCLCVMQGLPRGKNKTQLSNWSYNLKILSNNQQRLFHHNTLAHNTNSVRELSVCSTTQQQGGEECYSCHIISPCAHISTVLSLSLRGSTESSAIAIYISCVFELNWSMQKSVNMEFVSLNHYKIEHKIIQFLSLFQYLV